MTRYLSLVEMMIINEEIIGGQSQLRDVDLLESAVLRPQSSAFGEDAYPSVPEKAGALFHSLARNHAFVDGNKRTSTVALILFLKLNGYRVTWEPEDALNVVLDAATGQTDLADITEWLQHHTAPVEAERSG